MPSACVDVGWIGNTLTLKLGGMEPYRRGSWLERHQTDLDVWWNGPVLTWMLGVLAMAPYLREHGAAHRAQPLEHLVKNTSGQEQVEQGESVLVGGVVVVVVVETGE